MFRAEVETGTSRVDPGAEQQISSFAAQDGGLFIASLAVRARAVKWNPKRWQAPQCPIVTPGLEDEFQVCWLVMLNTQF